MAARGLGAARLAAWTRTLERLGRLGRLDTTWEPPSALLPSRTSRAHSLTRTLTTAPLRCAAMATNHAAHVLLIGAGGREHALAWSLARSQSVVRISVAPGNGGTAAAGGKIANVPIQPIGPDFSDLVRFAVNNKVDLVVPGPEQPLVEGIETAFRKVGIPCFGPSKAASRIEGSKAFAKDFMTKHRIPTAAHKTFTRFEDAKAYIESLKTPFVIKASGLAAGKGVLLPETLDEAVAGLHSMMLDSVFGPAGAEVVIEERMTGEEVSVLALSDGYTVVPFPAAQDHKRVFDGDKGPNTGGMGAYAPAPVYTSELAARVMRTILQPTVDGMRRDGFPFVGILYAGLMLTPEGPKVVEFNCRFGDPETQVVLPLLEDSCDLADILLACATSRLDSVRVSFKSAYAATVVGAAKGYPGSYAKGTPIKIPQDMEAHGSMVFHAGTVRDAATGALLTSGGRVLATTAVASTLPEALSLAKAAIRRIEFDGIHFRNDIGYRALHLLESRTKSAAASTGTTYADAGVSIDAGNLFVDKIKSLVKATRRSGADADIGGFGGVFDLAAAGYKDPILVSGTDGVGTKLKIAHLIGKHDTIGIDLVAMSVNDVIVQGAEPLFFLDYYACSHLDVDVARDVVHGIARGCKESGCALIGGETAEMPGMYAPGDYDLAGFVVGAVERTQLLPRLDTIRPGDVLMGLASSGVHSNGFSLVRHVVAKSGLDYASVSPFKVPDAGDAVQTLGEALLTPTRLYIRQLLPVVRSGRVKALAHITGGGFIDNVPRVLPDDVDVVVDARTWPLLPVFQWIKTVGGVANAEVARTFNCGIGMVLVVAQVDVPAVRAMLQDGGEVVYEIGHVVERKEGVSGEAHHDRVHMVGMDESWGI